MAFSPDELENIADRATDYYAAKLPPRSAWRGIVVDEWKWIIRRAWSVRLIMLAGVLSGIEVVLPYLSDSFPRGPFLTLSFMVTVGALLARFVAQKRDDE